MAARTYSMRASASVLPRTSRLSCAQPSGRQHADDEGDEDVGRRRDRDQRGQRQVERQLREGEDELDEALHPGVEPAAEIARGDADAGADDRGDAHDDQRDGQRDPRADDAAREDVAAELVGAEEMDRAGRRSPPKKWTLAGISQRSL